MNPPLDDNFRWLFLDLDSYFASCEQQARPDLRGKPVGVVPLMAETTCCLAASYQAKRYGVKTGTLVAEARVRCPGIVFVTARHDLYTLYHNIIIETVNTYIPIDTVLGIDEMICELKGSQRERTKALALAATIKEAIRHKVGETLTCSIGLAPNRFLAKVASDRNKPNGVTLFSQGDLPQVLYPLKLRDFPGIGPRMEERLHDRGISSVQTLCGLSLERMRDVWGGVVGERFYHWLRGEDAPVPDTVHRSMGHQHVLEPEFRTSEGAWRITKKLLVKAAVRLRKEGSYTRRLTLQIHFAGGQSWDNGTRVDETQDTLVLLAALRELWKTLPKGTPFRTGVTLSELLPKHQHQLSLLTKPARENLGEAMDKINRKYGKETLSVGDVESQAVSTKIAFSRVPDMDEF